MSKKKQGSLTLATQVAQATGADIPQNKQINPVYNYNAPIDQYMKLWTNYDMNQVIARYVWDNLPNGLTSWNLERMLYFRGSLAGFIFAGRGYILPYTMTGPELINIYGLPTKVRPITYNGQAPNEDGKFFGEDFDLPVDVHGNETDKYSAVLLYDSVPYSASTHALGRFFYNQIIIKEICSVFARININVVISNKKIMLVIKDAKQAEIVRKELASAFSADCPFVIITSPFDTETVQNTNDFYADDLFATIKNYDAVRCFMNGITSSNYGAQKKERMITGELSGSEEQAGFILDMGLEMRQLFCDQCNKKFGWNISVRKRADDYKEEQEKIREKSEQNSENGNKGADAGGISYE